MTIALLASVSLLALVVTSRPIHTDADLCKLVPAPFPFQTALQEAFQIHPGKDDLRLDAARFQPQKSKQLIECLSAPDSDNVGSVASFEISPGVTPPEVSQDDTAGGHGALDSGSDALVDELSEPTVEEGATATPLVVLVFSCVAALLALACTALTVYTIKLLRSHMLASKAAWKILPHFWRRASSRRGANTMTTQRLSGGSRLLLQTGRLVDVEQGPANAHDTHTEDKPLYFDTVSDMESDCGDVEEKYQDALDTTPLSLIHDLPLEEGVPHPTPFDDPALPPTGTCPLDQPTGDRSTLLMRELCSSPVPGPAWSVRAIGSPTLGLSSREGDGMASTPQPLIHPHRRAYRSAVPEFDVALAMQLRPGLGIGADSAWMVRFLMTIFGWFAVALAGRTQ